MASKISLARTITFGVVTLFSVISLALGAHWISWTSTYAGVYYNYAALAVATGVLSLSLPVLWYVDHIRRGAITSWIVVELSWLYFLWVMWLSTAALAASNWSILRFACDFYAGDNGISTGCAETQAVIAFAFLNWGILSAYITALTVLSLMAHNKGNPVWKSSVKEADFCGASQPTTSALGTPELKPNFTGATMGTPQAYPPQPQGYPVHPQTPNYPQV